MIDLLQRAGLWLENSVRRIIRRVPGDAWIHRPYRSAFSPVIIGGCGRSGSTLLSAMLDSHPRLCCGPESRLFPTPDVHPERLARLFHLPPVQVRQLIQTSDSKAQFIERFADACCQAAGKTRWAEKSPGNVKVLPWIFERFPEARFIHLIRDGRDVVCSLRTHPQYKMVRGQRRPTGIRRPMDRCCRRWVDYVRAGLAWRDDPRCLEVRYEDLVHAPEPTLRRVFDFLGEPWDPAVLDYHQRQLASADPQRTVQNPGIDRPIYSSALARWRRDLSPDDARTVKAIAGPLLIQLGYADNDEWHPDAPSGPS